MEEIITLLVVVGAVEAVVKLGTITVETCGVVGIVVVVVVVVARVVVVVVVEGGGGGGVVVVAAAAAVFVVVVGGKVVGEIVVFRLGTVVGEILVVFEMVVTTELLELESVDKLLLVWTGLDRRTRLRIPRLLYCITET